MEYRYIKYRNIGENRWEFTWPSGLKFVREFIGDINHEFEILNFIDRMLADVIR